ncbi:hypothetical protein SISSUDRAFT_1122338 [Sistotremastrum suecicum HHB10207 ss-3]|uniref:Uncharacterized protein n=1 Tax=Sistotremastrum suecicum HHB10207 ss-3 TaxID=1314776 RepID=A0A165ZHT7_9AGAM|nr:hypothetical protein SISSUDRAFT_1122338 [Sistotremastrum suecicum HHB10207 ss-3]
MSRRKSKSRRRTSPTRHSTAFTPSLPVEIWTQIFESAGFPLAKDVEDATALAVIFGLQGGRTQDCRPALWIESHRTLNAISLTCRQWSTICTPLIYNFIWISKPEHTLRLLPLLRRSPANNSLHGNTFGTAVRAVIISYFFISGAVLKSLCDLCPDLRFLDMRAVRIKNVSQWRAVEKSLSQLSSLRYLDSCWTTSTLADLQPSPKASLLPQLRRLTVSFVPWCGLGAWQTPALRDLSFFLHAFNSAQVKNHIIPFLRSNGSQIERLALNVDPDFNNVDAFSHFGGEALVPLCPNLRELSVSLPHLIPLIWDSSHPFRLSKLRHFIIALPSADRFDSDLLKPVFQSLTRSHFPRIQGIILGSSYPVNLSQEPKPERKVSLPSWWIDVLGTWKCDRIAVVQVPECIQLTYSSLIQYADFDDTAVIKPAE